MNKTKKLIAASLLVFSMLSFAGCTKSTDTASTSDTKAPTASIEKPSFETQKITTTDANYEIPTTWAKLEGAPVKVTGQVTYAPSTATINAGTSNVNIVVSDNTSSETLDSFKSNQDNIKNSLSTAFSGNASDFTFSDFKAPNGDVFVVEFTSVSNNVSMKQVQYYLIASKKIAIITSTDIFDNLAITPKEVGKHIANSFSLN